jgi:hypothetical protein
MTIADDPNELASGRGAVPNRAKRSHKLGGRFAPYNPAEVFFAIVTQNKCYRNIYFVLNKEYILQIKEISS